MRFGLDVATTGEWSEPGVLADLAVEAESSGYDGFFVWDILVPEGDPSTPVADPWVSLAAIASRTSRILIGALVTPIPRRHIWKLAREVVTLDRLSGGRVIFGAGLGWRTEEFEAFGQDPSLRSRAETLDEGLAILDAAWRGEEVRHVGRHLRVDGLTLAPRPQQAPRPPIWLAAGWPRRRPLERAARWDGVYLMTEHQETGEQISPDDVAEAVEVVRSARGSLDGFEVAANLDSTELAPAAAAEQARRLADAGATWVLELTPDTVEEHRALIRRGPPRS